LILLSLGFGGERLTNLFDTDHNEASSSVSDEQEQAAGYSQEEVLGYTGNDVQNSSQSDSDGQEQGILDLDIMCVHQ
jgi:hypothetical protein